MEVETVASNKTLMRSEILGEKVNNFMGIDVKVLDSRWFTTICRDEGFLVSGHFRLQPCKDEQGEWTRKLIYINPYAKHGYHRLAPIVNISSEREQRQTGLNVAEREKCQDCKNRINLEKEDGE